MSEEKVTIQLAAKVLNVTPKTIHRWLKLGMLSKVKEGSRTYILMDDIRALRQRQVITSKNDVPTFEGDMGQGNNLGNNIVPIERSHYKGLLTRLGQLAAKQALLLEYKEGLEKKDKELAETKEALIQKERLLQEKDKVMKQAGGEIQRLRAEVNRLRKPFWKRIFSK